mmetsp:Transcript_56420/g.174944  ORF Transcript_56420/g.174944 Transcript_56420/m.174944 type:complete len:367 (+) Transcript_56420:931-2031(+)
MAQRCLRAPTSRKSALSSEVRSCHAAPRAQGACCALPVATATAAVASELNLWAAKRRADMADDRSAHCHGGSLCSCSKVRPDADAKSCASDVLAAHCCAITARVAAAAQDCSGRTAAGRGKRASGGTRQPVPGSCWPRCAGCSFRAVPTERTACCRRPAAGARAAAATGPSRPATSSSATPAADLQGWGRCSFMRPFKTARPAAAASSRASLLHCGWCCAATASAAAAAALFGRAVACPLRKEPRVAALVPKAPRLLATSFLLCTACLRGAHCTRAVTAARAAATSLLTCLAATPRAAVVVLAAGCRGRRKRPCICRSAWPAAAASSLASSVPCGCCVAATASAAAAVLHLQGLPVVLLALPQATP